MYKYLLIPALCCLIISSCVTNRNSSQSWKSKEKKDMTVCDCFDLFTQIQKELIDSFHDNDSKASIESLRNEILLEDKYGSEITVCSELDKTMTQKQKEKLKKRAERCKSFKEFKLLTDSIMNLSIQEYEDEFWKEQSSKEMEEEMQKAIEISKELDSMEVRLEGQLDSIAKLEQSQSYLSDSISMLKKENEILLEEMNEYIEEIDVLLESMHDLEDMMEEIPDMEEYEEWPEEEGDKSACDCIEEGGEADRAPAGCEWMDNLDDNQLMEELKDCPEMAAMFEIVMPDMEEMDAIAPEMEEAIAEEYIDAELMSLRRLDELERIHNEVMELLLHLEETKLMIRELEDSLLYFDKIPDFDTDLCQCWFNQGVSDLEEDCVDHTLYTLEEEQELYERLWPDCELYDVVQEDLYILIDDYEEEQKDYNYSDLEMGLAELDIQIQEEELKLRFAELYNLEEEILEDIADIKGFQEDVNDMNQVINSLSDSEIELCECILEYYDGSRYEQDIKEVIMCDSSLTEREIRCLYDKCEDRARTEDNIVTPIGELQEHQELLQQNTKRIEELKKEIELKSQDFPDLAARLEKEYKVKRINEDWNERIRKWMSPYTVERVHLDNEYNKLLYQLGEIYETLSEVPDVDKNLCDCLRFSLREECEEEFKLSKEDVDSIISLCEELSYYSEDDIFQRRSEIWSELMDIESEIGTLNEDKLNKIKQENEQVWERWESRLENIVDNTIKEEKLRLVKNLLDQETTQADKVAEIDMGVEIELIEESNSRWSMKKEFIKEYDLLEELKQENIKALQELNSELPKLSFYYNADLAFKAQEIFSALESEDFDLFLDLVKVDTVDFFYWRIPSADFNRKNLEGMSIEIENMAGDPTTVQAMDYLSMFQSYDMNLLTTNWGFDRAAGWFGSCDRIVFKENTDGERDFTQYENVSFIFCPNEYLYEWMDPCEEIETLMQDSYRLEDALYAGCNWQDQLWFVFDTSNQKFIGIYDWQWTP